MDAKNPVSKGHGIRSHLIIFSACADDKHVVLELAMQSEDYTVVKSAFKLPSVCGI